MPGYISGTFHFWSIACMTSSLYYIQFNKCICNLTSEYSFNCGFKIFFDLSDEVYTQVVYITYNMGNRDLPAHALGPHIYIYIYILYVTTRFLTCDRFQNRSAHFKTGWPVLKREARASLKYLVIGR